jgi:hypothetical protein
MSVCESDIIITATTWPDSSRKEKKTRKTMLSRESKLKQGSGAGLRESKQCANSNLRRCCRRIRYFWPTCA